MAEDPSLGNGSGAKPKKLSRFEQKTPEEQEIERRKIKEAIAAKLKEKEQIICAVRRNIEQKKQTEQQGAGEDALHGQIEFDLGARFEYSLKDYEKARAMYEKAIDKGHGLASFNLATWYLEGKNGVKRDTAKALELMQSSAGKGVGMAMINLGYMYQNGLAGLEQDAHKAFALYQEGVKDVRNTVGDGNALLANMYATGNGCEADMAQAKWHLSQAKEKGTSVPPGLEELVFGKGGFKQYMDDLAHRRQRLMHAVHTEVARADWPGTAKGWAALLGDYGYGTPGAEWDDAPCEDIAAFVALAESQLRLLDAYKYQGAKRPDPRCEQCGKAAADMSKCSKCGALYCNKDCQRENWMAHKATCKLGYILK